ncbi:ankyrin repeat-containing domain protein [Lasiosphaeria hispida]|uniref:Ankyrin repeat-containing domain protein n=1 Tax=Lasiosphaeria hispida TaxID=260671 RepID=A0AAJ0HDW9_9PEZI|nr:ankyrin repeat-containing domain protein [Lasiosphaeria hispida]
MADPLSIITAIITLGKTLQDVSTLLSDFSNAPRKIVEIRRDCEFTKSVLENITQQIESNVLPPLLIDGDRNETSAGLNLANLLQDNVEQLALDIDALLAEIEKMRPSSPSAKSKLGRLLADGAVAWKTSYLEGMQQSILTKRNQLLLVESSLQSRIHTMTSQAAHHNARDGMAVLGDIFNIFNPRSAIVRRISVASDSPPNYQVRASLLRAVKEDRKCDVAILLDKTHPDFPSGDKDELYPIHIASKNGYLSIIDLLLSSGARVDRYAHGKTPLMFALEHNHAVAALALVRRGADISKVDSRGQSALAIAARKNLCGVVQQLLSYGADPNACDLTGRTPLMEAVCREGRDIQPHGTHVICALLRPNRDGVVADPTLGTLKALTTPLHEAAARGLIEDLRILATAVKPGSRSVLDASHRSPLWFAAKNTHPDAVKLLLPLTGADSVNDRSLDRLNPTALFAMASPSTATPPLPEKVLAGMSLLLTAGANPNARNTPGQTLLHRAAWVGDVALAALLLRHGADPCAADNKGLQPLHFAAAQGHQEAVAQLLGCDGVDIDCLDGEGVTPLIMAAENGHDFLVRWLVERKPRGADWRRREVWGCDAFHIACAGGHLMVAMYLLAKGADVNGQNKKGNTALHVAAREGMMEVVRFLLRMGADKGLKSDKPLSHMEVAGTAVEVARAAREKVDAKFETGHAERIALLIEGWKPERRREMACEVRFTGGW